MANGNIRRATKPCRHYAGAVTLAACGLVSPAFAENIEARAILFGSMDAGTSVFASGGVKAAPDRINREGFAILAVMGAGARFERAPVRATGATAPLLRTTGIAAFLGGYQFFFDWGVLGLYAGPEGSVESLVGSAGFGRIETRMGARLQGELWARPTENTLTTATLVLGSARWDTFGRVSAGYRLFGAYLGPEAAAYADRTGYAKFSAGLHATEFGFGAFTFRLSGGCSYESETRRLGPYVSVAGWMPL